MFHTGTDFAGKPVGTPIRAIAAGTVKESYLEPERKGNYIVVSHFPGLDSRYLHMNSRAVAAGEKVKSHQVIGTLGNTGISTGPHLHIEFRLFGIPLPPLPFLLPGVIFQYVGLYKIIDSKLSKESLKIGGSKEEP
jgi:murein DD-endopeptidase MepM/ murein hydrolase activator NlpD